MKNRLLALALLASFPAFAQNAEEPPPPEEMRASESNGSFGIVRLLAVAGGVGLVLYANSIQQEEPRDSALYLGAGVFLVALSTGSMLCPSSHDSRYSSEDARVVVAPMVLPKGGGAAVAVRF